LKSTAGCSGDPTGKAFRQNFPGMVMPPGSWPTGPVTLSDFGLHFFLYLRRDFLYYFR
jgi:hypothetical protein